jgi:hypothetical protein
LFDSIVMVIAKDRVSEPLYGIIANHEIAADDYSNITLAPSRIKVDQLFTWYTTCCLLQSKHRGSGNISIALQYRQAPWTSCIVARSWVPSETDSLRYDQRMGVG